MDKIIKIPSLNAEIKIPNTWGKSFIRITYVETVEVNEVKGDKE